VGRLKPLPDDNVVVVVRRQECRRVLGTARAPRFNWFAAGSGAPSHWVALGSGHGNVAAQSSTAEGAGCEFWLGPE
jgi:hypothetical protein